MEVTTQIFQKALKEYWAVASLSTNERYEYRLIQRYETKVSERLLNRKKFLLEKGKQEFEKQMTKLIQTPNPFLELVKKDLRDKEFGAYYSHPIIFGSSGSEE